MSDARSSRWFSFSVSSPHYFAAKASVKRCSIDPGEQTQPGFDFLCNFGDKSDSLSIKERIFMLACSSLWPRSLPDLVFAEERFILLFLFFVFKAVPFSFALWL